MQHSPFFYKYIRFFEKFFNAICVALLVLMSCITTIDVIGRYIFNSPLPGAYESNELLLALLIFAALPQVTWYRQHLTVTLIDEYLSPSLKKFQFFILSLISSICLGVLSYFLLLHAQKLQEYGDMSHALELPIHIFAFIIAFFTFISALTSFIHLFHKNTVNSQGE